MNPSARFLRRVVAAGVIAFAGAASLVAQVHLATLSGSVRSSDGDALPGVTVTLRSVTTNGSQDALTDLAGRFRFAGLQPGDYDLSAELNGFTTARQLVTLRVSQLSEVLLRLSPSLSEQVEVTASASPVSERSPAATTVVSGEAIEELPVTTRSFRAFVLLAPGVVRTETVSGTPTFSGSATSSSTPSSGFSFAGLRPRSNSLTVDGVSNDDEYAGGTRTELSPETIQEFDIVNHPWNVESGGAAGGAINVVSKTGANDFHGDAFLIARPQWLASASRFDRAEERSRIGGALGGALRRDRTFFYVAGELEQRRETRSPGLTPNLVQALNTALDAAFSARHPVASNESLDVHDRDAEFSLKVSQQSPSDFIETRLAYTATSEATPATKGVDASSCGTSRVEDSTVAASWLRVRGARRTHDVRAQIARRTSRFDENDVTDVRVLVPGVAVVGSVASNDGARGQDYLELAGTSMFLARRHQLKVGASALQVSVRGDALANGSAFTFPSVAAIALGRPSSFRQAFTSSRLDLSASRYGVFVQDEWSAHGTIDVVAGLRYDAENLPSQLAVNSRLLSPRIGFFWSPSGAWRVRAGAGRFADRIPLVAVEKALLLDGEHGFEQIVEEGDTALVLSSNGGAPLEEPINGVPPSIYRVRRGTWTPESWRASVGAERSVGSFTVATDYVFSEGRHELRTINVNLAPPVVLTAENAASLGVANPTPQQLGRMVFGRGRVDPHFSDIFELQPTASSRYQGITVTASQRLGGDAQWSLAYTYSRATDDASDYDEQPQNPYDVRKENSWSRYDQRHRLTASGLFEVGDEDDAATATPSKLERVFRNIEIAPIVTIASGLPYSALTGGDEEHSHAFNSRVLGQGRNDQRLPATVEVNVRIVRYFPLRDRRRVDLVAEAFNLFDRRLIAQQNEYWGSELTPQAEFGRSIRESPRRQLELSLDFEF